MLRDSSFSSAAADSDSARLNDNEPRQELVAESTNCIKNRIGHWAARSSGEPEKNHGVALLPLCVNEFAEIFVFRQ
jgi:hypothetical protein